MNEAIRMQVSAFVDGELAWDQLDAVTAAPTDWWTQAAPALLYPTT